MVDDKIKNQLLKEIAKNGIVYLSCIKTGIDKSTYYRWKETDKEFQKKANQAERYGRENNCDIAEHALMQNVKEKKMDAIKYILGHNSPRYRPKKNSNVVILHKKEVMPFMTQKSWEDLYDEEADKRIERHNVLIEKYKSMGGIPPKADGTPISDEELLSYETYIEEWYKKKKLDEEKVVQ
jgi:hypothetical protein